MIIAIDPGKDGAIAFYERFDKEEGGLRRAERVHRMVFPMGATEADTIETIVNMTNLNANPHAIIEKVHSMPGQGVSSTFKFGTNYGFLRGVIMTLGVPLHEVTPNTWQRHIGIPPRGKISKGSYKSTIKGFAQQRHPTLKLTLKTCDAILIADYAWEVYPEWR